MTFRKSFVTSQGIQITIAKGTERGHRKQHFDLLDNEKNTFQIKFSHHKSINDLQSISRKSCVRLNVLLYIFGNSKKSKNSKSHPLKLT